MAQRFTDTDTEVIRRARRKRRDVIVLREDSDWLHEYSPRPKDMLSRMAHRGALIPIGAGRYAIPVIGSTSPDAKAWQPMLHARLASMGDYYLGGFSALVEHRLTDLSETTAFVVAGFWNSALAEGEMTVVDRPIRAAITRRAVFDDTLGIETVRMSRSEDYRRSDLNRTLVDCLWHPELSGTPEVWITAWGRAAARSVWDVDAICRYALALSPSVACRAGVLLEFLGEGQLAQAALSRARRPGRFTPLVARGVSGDGSQERSKDWNVIFNIPRERVEGWLSYGK